MAAEEEDLPPEFFLEFSKPQPPAAQAAENQATSKLLDEDFYLDPNPDLYRDLDPPMVAESKSESESESENEGKSTGEGKAEMTSEEKKNSSQTKKCCS